MAHRASLAVALVPLLLVCSGTAAPPQAPPLRSPVGNRVTAGADISRYDALYGSPEFRTLDADVGSWPLRQAIRSSGLLERIPGRDRSRHATPAQLLRGTAWDNRYSLYRICREEFCLALVSVPELIDVFAGPVAAWDVRSVEVIGAVDNIDNAPDKPMAFLVWSIFEAPDRVTRQKREGSSLEPLVRYPKGSHRRVVTASGTFRGANLFEDLPPESRRKSGDWVLRDGPFSIWVTGKAPRGEGWSLDPKSKSDCTWRLDVTGKIETDADFIYLHATSVVLVARDRGEP